MMIWKRNPDFGLAYYPSLSFDIRHIHLTHSFKLCFYVNVAVDLFFFVCVIQDISVLEIAHIPSQIK